jgi:hypothetical protein
MLLILWVEPRWKEEVVAKYVKDSKFVFMLVDKYKTQTWYKKFSFSRDIILYKN